MKIIYNLIFKNKILIENNTIILFRTGPFNGTIGFPNEYFVECNIIVHSRIDLLKIIYNLIFKNKILIENNIIILFRTGPFNGTIGFPNEDIRWVQHYRSFSNRSVENNI